MGYRSALLLRWSRRDRLAVVVVATAVAFLTGATLLGVAAGEQTRDLAVEYAADGEVAHFDSLEAARAVAGDEHAVLPTATVTVDGRDRVVVGVPDPPPSVDVLGTSHAFPTAEPGVLESASGPADTVVAGASDSGDEVATATRSGSTLLPDDWFVTAPGTVERLGPDGSLVVATDAALAVGSESPTDAASGAASESPTDAPSAATSEYRPALPQGAPVLSALAFFLFGSRQLVDLLALATVAGGVLVAVTVYSVTRVTVEERREDLATVRATGGTPGQVYAVFAGRAALLTAAGVGLGYALGVILTRLVVNAAVFVGLPVSLSVAPAGPAAELLVPAALSVLLVGTLAGALATRPAVSAPPAAVRRRTTPSPPARTRAADGGEAPASAPRRIGSTVRRLLAGGFGAAAPTTTVLDRNVIAPATATLTVFVAFALLLSAGGTVVGPLASTDASTITQPGAPHPIASTVPESYAPALRQQGIDASPEILAFEAVGGEPFVARGVNYSAYASLSEPTVVRGRSPGDPDEAVVGVDLATALGVDVGDRVALGGSTDPAVTRVRVVGVFAGRGMQDDQLLVSLPTARHLTGRGERSVHFVRVSDLPEASADASALVVLDAEATSNESATRVRVVARNYGLSAATRTLGVSLGDRTRSLDLSASPGRRAAGTVVFPRPPDGTYRLRAGDVDRSVTVGAGSGVPGDDSSLALVAPEEAPTGSQARVLVTAGGRPVRNATVRVGNRTLRTDGDGGVQVSFEAAGRVALRAAHPATNGTGEATVEVRETARRSLLVDLSVRPRQPTVVTRPEAVVTATNPWATNVTRTLTIGGPDTTATRAVSLAPGKRTTVAVGLSRRPAGTYEVTVSQPGAPGATHTYDVRGDERLAAALASSGRGAAGGGVTQAAEVVFGNLQALVAGLIALTGAMTVGATTASFVRSVRASRREIGIRRAVGATPASIARLVLGDALKLGVASTVAAVALAIGVVGGLLALGRLRLFGVALRPTLDPWLLGGVAALALALVVVSAGLATATTLSASPAALLDGPDRGGDRR